MKKTMLLLALCALVFTACEPNQPKHPNNWSPRGRMYVDEYSWLDEVTMEHNKSYDVIYFLSTEKVVRYATTNSDYSVNESYDKADTCILQLKYPDFIIKRDVWSNGSIGKFIDINTIKYGSDIYKYVK